MDTKKTIDSSVNNSKKVLSQPEEKANGKEKDIGIIESESPNKEADKIKTEKWILRNTFTRNLKEREANYLISDVRVSVDLYSNLCYVNVFFQELMGGVIYEKKSILDKKNCFNLRISSINSA